MLLIQFQKFNQEQYQDFKKLSIHDYAESFFKTGNYNKDDAFKKAEDEFEHILSQGLETPNHYLYTIYNEEQNNVGYIWYDSADEGFVFLCDFMIYEEYRRKGYATQALALLEQEAKRLGRDKILLNVFDYNTEAKALYEKCGYVFASAGEDGCRYLNKLLI